jgi:hypothetical protein
MSVQFIGWEKVGSGLYGAGHAYFSAPASAVAIDRGCGSEYYFGRRMYVSVGPFSKGVADSGRAYKPGDTISFNDGEVLLY